MVDCVSISLFQVSHFHMALTAKEADIDPSGSTGGGSCCIWMKWWHLAKSIGEVEFVSLFIAVVLLCLIFLFCAAFCSILCWWLAAMPCAVCFLVVGNHIWKGVGDHWCIYWIRFWVGTWGYRLNFKFVSNQLLTTSLLDFALLTWGNSRLFHLVVYGFNGSWFSSFLTSIWCTHHLQSR